MVRHRNNLRTAMTDFPGHLAEGRTRLWHIKALRMTKSSPCLKEPAVVMMGNRKQTLEFFGGNTFCPDNPGDSLGPCSVIYQESQVFVLQRASILVSSPVSFIFLQAAALNRVAGTKIGLKLNLALNKWESKVYFSGKSQL